MDIIEQKLQKVTDYYKKNYVKDLRLEHAFSYLVIQYFYNNGESIEDINYRIRDCLTDGKDDGGIDFVYYDEDNSQIIIGQSKFTTVLTYEDARVEIIKMANTLENFKKSNYSMYNEQLKSKLLSILSNLDDNSLKYCIFTSSDFSHESFVDSNRKFSNLPSDEVYQVYNRNDIIEQINLTTEQPFFVTESSIKLDKANNYLLYDNEEAEGIIVNISANSLKKLHSEYGNKGLYSLNIRNYIKNSNVDNKIYHTLDIDRQNFWFLNNGITIVCEEYILDGNSIKLYNFSIVNGGQTTNRIGNYKGKNNSEFFVVCKIVRTRKDDKNQQFSSKIAEATNSQKPILLRDLRSNSPEMKYLKNALKERSVFLEIKRGEKRISNFNFIRNDELGQIILSFVHQRPGTARSNKKSIFETDIYNLIFKFRHHERSENLDFIVDLVKLRMQIRDTIKSIIEDKENPILVPTQLEVYANSEQTIIAIFGVIYALKNNYITRTKLLSNSETVKDIDIERHSIISKYKADDYKLKMKTLIRLIVKIITEYYLKKYKDGEVKGVSNFLKTDTSYYNILKVVFEDLLMFEQSTTYQLFKDSINIIDSN